MDLDKVSTNSCHRLYIVIVICVSYFLKKFLLLRSRLIFFRVQSRLPVHARTHTHIIRFDNFIQLQRSIPRSNTFVAQWTQRFLNKKVQEPYLTSLSNKD